MCVCVTYITVIDVTFITEEEEDDDDDDYYYYYGLLC